MNASDNDPASKRQVQFARCGKIDDADVRSGIQQEIQWTAGTVGMDAEPDESVVQLNGEALDGECASGCWLAEQAQPQQAHEKSDAHGLAYALAMPTEKNAQKGLFVRDLGGWQGF
jgi:hypothetical protein